MANDFILDWIILFQWYGNLTLLNISFKNGGIIGSNT
jgi:hypothetical protein